MYEKVSNDNRIPYVSCIKINGVPILPPLITPVRRKELLRYKQQAVRLEQRLNKCRELETNVHLSNTPVLTERTTSDLSIVSHIDALGLSDHSIELLNSINNRKNVPKPRNLSLTSDIVDVTQYNADGIRIISNDLINIPPRSTDETSNTDLNTNQINIPIDLKCPSECQSDNTSNWTKECTNVASQKSPVDNSKGNSIKRNICSTQKPRLIRSNSYTLETPSPILLAHLEKNGEKVEHTKTEFNRNWTSLENNYIPFEKSEFSSMNTVCYNDDSDVANDSTDISNKNENTTVSKSPTIEVFQTDISVQQITVNTCNTSSKGVSDNVNSFYAKDMDDLCDLDPQIMEVLKDIPDTYSKQIIDLMKKQKKEQKERLERYDKPKHSTDPISNKSPNKEKQNIENEPSLKNPNSKPCTDNSLSCTTSNTLLMDSPVSDSRPSTGQSEFSNKLNRSSTFSISPSQSIYSSISSASLTTPNKEGKIDVGGESETTFNRIQENTYSWKGKELFPPKKPRIDAAKRAWAASVICAHVKGYLTRRLLKTEKVQSLIDTIKDALLCALELHNLENVEEADIELHRRLIQQVTAACYAFYDIFFSLPIEDQMQIIALDRQRKIEKAKRPVSAPISHRSLSSSVSLPTRRKQGLRSQSLTKI